MAVNLIRNVEIPVCLNLALSYMKTEQYHYGIKYCTQVLDKNLKPEQIQGGVASFEKCLYRRAQCYFKIGDLKKAKGDFLKANEIMGLAQKEDPSIKKNPMILQGLRDIVAKQEQNKEKERQMSKRMFEQNKKKEDTKQDQEWSSWDGLSATQKPKGDQTKKPVFEGKIQ